MVDECLTSTMKTAIIVGIEGYIGCLKRDVDRMAEESITVEGKPLGAMLAGMSKQIEPMILWFEELKKEIEKIPECK